MSIHPPLPPCKLDTIRDFLYSKGFKKSDSFSDSSVEIWMDDNELSLVELYLNQEKIPYTSAILIAEQVGCHISEIPFYKSQINQRFPLD